MISEWNVRSLRRISTLFKFVIWLAKKILHTANFIALVWRQIDHILLLAKYFFACSRVVLFAVWTVAKKATYARTKKFRITKRKFMSMSIFIHCCTFLRSINKAAPYFIKAFINISLGKLNHTNRNKLYKIFEASVYSSAIQYSGITQIWIWSQKLKWQ